MDGGDLGGLTGGAAALGFYLPLVFVAWLLAFSTTWLDRGLVRGGLAGPRGLFRTARFTWGQSAGLALVLYPFVKFAYGVWVSWGFLVNPQSLAPPMSVDELYVKFVAHAVQYFVVPFVGVLLVLRKWPLRAGATARKVWRDVSAAMRRVGATVKVSPLHDAMHGLWLFAAFSVVYGVSLLALDWINSLSGGALSSGDDTHVFDNITPALVFLLALVAGVTEEFLFRGLLQTKLRGAFGGGRAGLAFALLAQSAFFGLIHAGYGTWSHVLGPAFFGLFEGLVAVRFGLLAAVVVHVNIDVIAFGSEAAQQHPWMAPLLVVFYLACIAVPGAYFWRRARAQPVAAA